MEKVFDELKNISLDEVSVFFPKKAYDVLIKYNINSLYDLFSKYNNQELINMFFKDHKQAHELWGTISGTINVLRCKYLGCDLLIDFNSENNSFCDTIGLNKTVRKRIRCDKSLSLPRLFKMCENNDYSKLYFNFDAIKANEIIAKIKVLYEYKKKKDSNFPKEELRDMQAYLELLVKEYNKLVFEIERVKKIIKEKKESIGSVSK